MAGFPINIIGFPIPKINPYEENAKLLKIRGLAGEFMDIILIKLNATPNLTVADPIARGIIDENGVPSGTQKDVLRGKYDVQMNSELQRGLWHNEINTLISSGVCYVAKKELILVNKYFFTIFPLNVWLILGVICSMIIVIYKQMLEKSYTAICLEMLRAITGVGMSYVPTFRLRQTIFISFVFLSMTANFFFQGKLSALQTAPEYSIDLDEPMDLIRLNYTLYGEDQYQQHMYGTIFARFFKTINSTNHCIELLKQQSKIACAIDCWSKGFNLPNSKLMYVMEDDGNRKPFVVMVRDGFSLGKEMKKM